MSSIAVVINPVAGSGKANKIWQIMHPGLNALFDKVDYRLSNNMDDISSLSKTLLEAKPDILLVIGGDGTLNNAVNGIIKDDLPRQPETSIAYYNAGSGGDYIRQFPKQRMMEFFHRLKQRETIQTNIGKLVLSDGSVRYFINIASCGLSGYIAKLTQHSKWLKKLGGTSNYLLHAVIGLLKYKNTPARIYIDDHKPLESQLLLMAVCNGQYFGGGMHVAPMADIHDGLLDVIIFQDLSKFSAIMNLLKIYSGKHILNRHVHYIHAKKVRIEGLDSAKIAIEADGECVGYLPVSFELLDAPLSLIV